MAKQFTLSKTGRLKGRKAIDGLFKEGKSFYLAPFRIVFCINDKEITTGTELAVSVSKRYFKKAVQRNRIKRLVKESWRLQQTEWSHTMQQSQRQAQVFIIYTDTKIPDFSMVKEKMAAILKKLNQLTSESNSSIT